MTQRAPSWTASLSPLIDLFPRERSEGYFSAVRASGLDKCNGFHSVTLVPSHNRPEVMISIPHLQEWLQNMMGHIQTSLWLLLRLACPNTLPLHPNVHLHQGLVLVYHGLLRDCTLACICKVSMRAFQIASCFVSHLLTSFLQEACMLLFVFFHGVQNRGKVILYP